MIFLKTPKQKFSNFYVYFYYQGLALLRPGGVFCFINSNSWLDVGYGAGLQEFLLKEMELIYIIDNLAKRSFSASDVNTVIVLIKRPIDKIKEDSVVKFVAFKRPFEEVLKPDILVGIEEAKERSFTEDYRIFPKTREGLLQEGVKIPEEGFDLKDPMLLKYVGNKWGGKYLRAPEIFFKILEKGKGKLVRLGDIAEVRFGIKTGANEFFYLEPTGKPAPEGLVHVRNGAGWEGFVEEEFLRPFLFSLKEIERYEVEVSPLKRLVFVCRQSKDSLYKFKKNYAFEYITYGERKGFNQRPSVKARNLWYALPKQPILHFVSNRFLGERLGFPFIQDILVCDVFFVGSFYNESGVIGTALLNSTISLLSAEILSRKTYGIGVAYLYGPEIKGLHIIDPKVLSPSSKQKIEFLFTAMRKRQILKIEKEINQPDRRELDKIVFEALGLTEEEQLEVYRAVVELVKNRLVKARSV